PYTSQAPDGSFVAPYDNYCEAAAIIMVGQYFSGDRRDRIPHEEAKTRLNQIGDYEKLKYPQYVVTQPGDNDKDLPLTAISEVASHFYPKLRGQIVRFEPNAVKQSLAAKKPVIIPIMLHGAEGGEKLNTHYGKGDSYHTLVLIGYDEVNQLVYANDPGFNILDPNDPNHPTDGKNVAYSWDNVSSAVEAQAHNPKLKFDQGREMLAFNLA
ncbi:MAG: C39 family peptidase, partial [Candidatus Dormibacteraceae bacterium]